MISTKRRMVVMATLVCGFAVGMSALLNYFKYRSTMHGIITERVNSTGRSVQNSIMGALALGLQFGDIETLPGTLQRERTTDDVIVGIDVFNTQGTILYTTDAGRSGRQVPPAWVEAATKPRQSATWFVDGQVESATGMAVDNNFGLRIGYIALRYSNERVHKSMHEAVRELAVASFAVFIVAAALSSLLLIAVIRQLDRDVESTESALGATDPVRALAATRRVLFGSALQRFVQTVSTAEGEIASVRAQLKRSAPQ